MANLLPIKFISPSSFYYWEKCPLLSVFKLNFGDTKIFPQHPDADLGTLIHTLIENRRKWSINDYKTFEIKWEEEIHKINNHYKNDVLQKVYYPIEWNSKYYAVKKNLLRTNLIKEHSNIEHETSPFEFEKWIDDGVNIGGRVDMVKFNDRKEIVEIIDIKTGNIFEYIDNKKSIKQAYYYQLALYTHLVLTKQNRLPSCYIQDSKGEKFRVEINLMHVKEIYNKAVDLKKRINTCVEKMDLESLASPTYDGCLFCNYRPLCTRYKAEFINNFSNRTVDLYGEILKINYAKRSTITIKVCNKTLTLKNILSIEEIKVGDAIYVYNLYCPDENENTLFATKTTIVKYD